MALKSIGEMLNSTIQRHMAMISALKHMMANMHEIRGP